MSRTQAEFGILDLIHTGAEIISLEDRAKSVMKRNGLGRLAYDPMVLAAISSTRKSGNHRRAAALGDSKKAPVARDFCFVER